METPSSSADAVRWFGCGGDCVCQNKIFGPRLAREIPPKIRSQSRPCEAHFLPAEQVNTENPTIVTVLASVVRPESRMCAQILLG